MAVEGIGGLLIPLLFLAVLWFLLIRPQQKRQKEHQQLVRNLEVGDDIVTISGLHGHVVALTDESVDIEVTDDVVLRFQRGSVGRVIRDDEPAES